MLTSKGFVLLFIGTVRQKVCLSYRNVREANTTLSNIQQAAIGWHPDTLAVRTSNRLIEAIKPQRQRALRKPLLPAATDLHPSFFPPSSIHQVISAFIHCFLIHTSFPPPQHVYPSISHPPLLLWVWCLANGQAQRLVGTLSLPHPVGTAPVKHARLLWCLILTQPTPLAGHITEGKGCETVSLFKKWL